MTIFSSCVIIDMDKIHKRGGGAMYDLCVVSSNDRLLLQRLEKAISRAQRPELYNRLYQFFRLAMESGLTEEEVKEVEALIASL